MRHPHLLLPTILSAAIACLSLARAHGGVYRGPDDLVPRPVQAPPPDLPGLPPKSLSGVRIGPDLTRWQYWWEFHKEFFLRRGSRTAEAARPASGSAGLDAKDRKRILDRLHKALAAANTGPKVRAASLIALAKVAGKAAPLPTFLAFVADPDQETSETAVIAMGIAGLDQAATDLLALAADDTRGRSLSGRKVVYFRTRAFACLALGLIARQSQDMAMQGRILTAMEALASRRQTTAVDIRTAALTAIRLLHFDRSQGGKQLLTQATDYLRAFIDKDKELGRVQAHAVTAWATLVQRNGTKREEIERRLIQLIDRRRTSVYIQQSAILGLGLLADPQDTGVSEALRRYRRKGKDRQARHLVSISLGRIGGAKNKSFLAQPFLDSAFENSIPRLEIPWRALGLAILEENARRSDPTHRPDIELAKGIHQRFRRSQNPNVVAGLSLVLGILRYGPATEDIADRFKKTERSIETAGYLCLALGLMHDSGFQNLIRSGMDPDNRSATTLLRQGSRALGLLEDRSAASDLIRILQHPRMLVSVHSAAALALERLGGQSMVKTLLPLAEDTNRSDLSRAFAIATLGLLADTSPLPWNDAFLPGLNYRAMVETLSSKRGEGILDIL